MKKLLLLLALMLSCITSQAKVGVYMFFADGQEQLYEDDNMCLFVGIIEAGKVGIVVQNKTTGVLYIDKANSFFYLNGNTESFFTNAAYSTGTSNSSGGSVNLGGAARAMGIGGVAGGLLSGTTIGGGSTSTSTTTVFEQRVIGIAPQSSQVLKVFEVGSNLNSAVIKKGDGSNIAGSKGKFIDPMTGGKEKFQKGGHRQYVENNSPLSVKAAIKYSTREDFAEEASAMATARNFVEHVVIDEKTGIKTGNIAALPYCAPYANRTWAGFYSNGSWWGCVAIIAGVELFVVGGTLLIVSAAA